MYQSPRTLSTQTRPRSGQRPDLAGRDGVQTVVGPRSVGAASPLPGPADGAAACSTTATCAGRRVEVVDDLPVRGVEARHLDLLADDEARRPLEHRDEHGARRQPGAEAHGQADRLPQQVDLGVLEGVVALRHAEVAAAGRAPVEDADQQDAHGADRDEQRDELVLVDLALLQPLVGHVGHEGRRHRDEQHLPRRVDVEPGRADHVARERPEQRVDVLLRPVGDERARDRAARPGQAEVVEGHADARVGHVHADEQRLRGEEEAAREDHERQAADDHHEADRRQAEVVGPVLAGARVRPVHAHAGADRPHHHQRDGPREHVDEARAEEVVVALVGQRPRRAPGQPAQQRGDDGADGRGHEVRRRLDPLRQRDADQHVDDAREAGQEEDEDLLVVQSPAATAGSVVCASEPWSEPPSHQSFTDCQYGSGTSKAT